MIIDFNKEYTEKDLIKNGFETYQNFPPFPKSIKCTFDILINGEKDVRRIGINYENTIEFVSFLTNQTGFGNRTSYACIYNDYIEFFVYNKDFKTIKCNLKLNNLSLDELKEKIDRLIILL